MDNNKECKKTNNNIKINLKEYQKVKKVLKENYIYMIRQAYKCIQQIIQYTAYYKRISALNADFGKIVTYYHNNVLNRMKQTKVYLPDYNADMFLGIILFPKDELYLNNMENEKMLMDIDSKIIKGKEKQIQIENIIFNGKCECLLNPKIKKAVKDINIMLNIVSFLLI